MYVYALCVYPSPKQNENGIQAQEMWQLSQYLQDALYREQMLENKLANLQRLLADSQAAAEDNTQVLIKNMHDCVLCIDNVHVTSLVYYCKTRLQLFETRITLFTE